MELHPDETVLFEGHPSWRARMHVYALGFAGAVAAGLLAGVAAGSGVGVPVFLVIFAVVLAWGFVKRSATHYVLTSQRLHIRRGILSRRVQQTRLDRVQNVNTSQTLVERMLRIGTVDFDTAGTDDSEFAFHGIAEPSRLVATVDRAQRGTPARR
jgi:uncharacterized membrane protein YdbT with pleckstrin-like domain